MSVFSNGEDPAGRPVQLWAKLQEESRLHQSALEREKQLQQKVSALLKLQSQAKQRDNESPQIIENLTQEIKMKDQHLSLKNKELNQSQIKSEELIKQLHVSETKLKSLGDELIRANNHARELEEASKEKTRKHEELIDRKNLELKRQSDELKQIVILKKKISDLELMLQNKSTEYEGGQAYLQGQMQEKYDKLQAEAAKKSEELQNKIRELESLATEKEKEVEKKQIAMQDEMKQKQQALQSDAAKTNEELQNKINELETCLKEKSKEFEVKQNLMQEEMERRYEEFQAEENKQLDDLEKELDERDAQLLEKEKECTDLKTFIEGQMQQKYEESKEVEYLKKIMAEQTLEMNIQDVALTKQDEFIQELTQKTNDLEKEMKRQQEESEVNLKEAVESQLQQLEKLQQEQLDLLHQQLEKQNLMLQQQDLRLHQQDQLIETINNKNIFVSWGIK